MFSRREGLKRLVVPGPASLCLFDDTSIDKSLLWHVDKGKELRLAHLLRQNETPEWPALLS